MKDTDPDYNYVALQTNYNETHVVGVLGDGMVFHPLVHYGCGVSSTECIHYLLHAQPCPDTFLCLNSSSTSAGCTKIGPWNCDVGQALTIQNCCNLIKQAVPTQDISRCCRGGKTKFRGNRIQCYVDVPYGSMSNRGDVHIGRGRNLTSL